MNEEWRAVKGFEGLYEVSNTGRVRSIRSNKVICQGATKNGYLKCNLSKGGIVVSQYIHKLVADAFLPNPNGYPCMNHKDENKCNNHVDNLEWCTHRYNNNYGTRNKRIADKLCKPVAQLKDGLIVAVYSSAKEAGRLTGINQYHIGECCRTTGQRYKAGGFEWNFLKNQEVKTNEND